MKNKMVFKKAVNKGGFWTCCYFDIEAITFYLHHQNTASQVS